MPDQMSLQPTAPIVPEVAEQQPDIPDMSGINPLALQQSKNLADTVKLYKVIKQMAAIYANSTMIPSDYQGKPDNCFVAIELAGRMNVSPILVMQNLYIVKGRPSWSGQSCVAIINGSGKFKGEVKFIFIGEKEKDSYGCYCTAVRKSDGEVLTGTEITIAMAKAEGWWSKKNRQTGDETSKWPTMTRQMLMYRAAAFFARVYCPEVLMGYSLADEIEDITQAAPEKKIVKVE